MKYMKFSESIKKKITITLKINQIIYFVFSHKEI